MRRTRADSFDNVVVSDSPYSAEAKENEMISLAYAAAEKQMREGTASSQVITHFLKLGTVREKLELEKLKSENELLKTKRQAIESAERIEELYTQAIKAMSIYNGENFTEDDSDEYADQNL